MEAIDFLRERGLLSEEREKFTIIQEDDTQHDLIQILNDFADLKWKDKFLRLAADFENYKKRVEIDKNNLKIDSKISSLTSIIELENEMSIAYKMLNDDSLKGSVKIFLDKLQSFLVSQELEEIQTNEYDSEMHEVIHIMEEGSDKIADVISKGYKYKGKVIKYPKIVLSK
jgi:molecular chaperone GrpE